MALDIGDRVYYTYKLKEGEKKLGCYPPFGTHGTIVDCYDDHFKVKWDSGTRGNGIWNCGFLYVREVPCYKIEVLIGNVCFSHICETTENAYAVLCNVFEALPYTKRDDVDFKQLLAEMESDKQILYNKYPIAICRIHGTGVLQK